MANGNTVSRWLWAFREGQWRSKIGVGVGIGIGIERPREGFGHEKPGTVVRS